MPEMASPMAFITPANAVDGPVSSAIFVFLDSICSITSLIGWMILLMAPKITNSPAGIPLDHLVLDRDHHPDDCAD